ncbi:hypothetical protein [Spiroplasma poulsonii]|uniref:Uncharacterized protein n=1 Tax=Spiroplasma poulsonii TaxID=2138 RepID=A0A2P6FC27_9MOLU|nr:hypothetical protein [Spiroplasma poulsonii]KAF0851425.1 Chromosome partitioning protein ParA [Spiroplasma poulsonii]PQM31019.1 hypothetical protein SMSRO_SF008170 [Spiroplasma poulsonii]PWF96017.1 hypothetical protein SMSE_14550 [Spiroplasma poulsonii]PWF98792.1 hypothetical protein SMH99_13550 [Spiroplasma poulsonii]UNF62313.1 hypothetical protein MNU24_02295 [Spiroplasma poulsonii]
MENFNLDFIRNLTRLVTFNNAEQLYQTKKGTLDFLRYPFLLKYYYKI